MSIKWIGGGMLLLSALVYCYQYEHRAAQTKRVLEAWITLLTDIRRHISCFGTPLPNILLHVDPAVLAVLEIQGQPLTATALPACCRAHAPGLPKGCGELLERLAQELGTVWRQEQVERLDYYVEALTAQKEAFCVSSKGAARTRRILSFCGALGVILLVW